MAYNYNWQMNCCLGCGGPLMPSWRAQSSDKVGMRSIRYIENKAINNPTEWGVAANVEVNLVTVPENLHTVHQENSLPVVRAFFTGALQSVWMGNNTPSYNWANIAAGQPLNSPMPNGSYVIRSPNGRGGNAYRAVFWRSPAPIAGVSALGDLIRQCINDSNIRAAPGDPRPTPRVLPDPNMLISGCKACNQIMTQEGTMRHLLVRDVASQTPLVPLNSIIRYDLNRDPSIPPLGTRTTALRVTDPNVGNISNVYFSFQATIAYYIHRCLRRNPRLPAGGAVAVPPNEMPFEYMYRQFDVLFAYILLEICALMFERNFGIEGGRALRNKPAYRYRGLAEMYVSYILWMLLVNDVYDPLLPGGPIVDISFPEFHRYWFCELLDTLTLTHQAAAGAAEINDLIFGDNVFAVGGAPILPAHRMVAPELVIGHMATSIANFYTRILKPSCFRHMAGMDPAPLPPGAGLAAQRLYEVQRLVKDMLVDRVSLGSLMRRCETCVQSDIDSFLNRVGIHSVLKQWTESLRSAPPKVDNMLYEWIDAWTVHEYENILTFLRQNPYQPKLSPPVAESIYLMCNVLELPTEPTNQEELNALREAPKCSPHKAAERLEKAGAFRDPED